LCYRKPSWKDGSTAAAVLLVDNTIYIGNLGDSKVCSALSILVFYRCWLRVINVK